MHGKVIKILADLFTVYTGEATYSCSSRGKLKREGIIVGDGVTFFGGPRYTIEKVDVRKNQLERPPVANIDQMLIVLASIPEPDFILVDKLIIKCFENKITPIVIINKCDLNTSDFTKQVHDEYDSVVNNVLEVSAITGEGKKPILELLKGKVTCFAGQSAVGKSQLTLLLGGSAVVGELSTRINRGKNTTRHNEIFLLDDGIMLADTPCFSRLELNEIKYTDLTQFYPDFSEFEVDCKFKPCYHIFEKDEYCGVKKAVNVCKMNKNRYNRYIQIYNELKTYWEKMYD